MNAQQLVQELERQGVKLWADTEELRFRAPKGVLTQEHRAALRREKRAVVALLSAREGELSLSQEPARANEPFALTDVQAAYLLGRGHVFQYGGVGCHGYGELFFRELDAERMTAAFRKLVRRHDMLRATVAQEGTQRVLPEVPDYEISLLDLSAYDQAEVEAALSELRGRLDHRVYDPASWPLFDLRVTQLPEGALLHFSLDLLIADFVSTQLLLEELGELYQDPTLELAPLAVTFRDYQATMQRLAQSERFERDRQYWLERIDALPRGPELPVLEHKAEQAPRFERRKVALDAARWRNLSALCSRRGITASVAVLAAYAEALDRWCARPQFTLNLTLQNRLPIHLGIDRVIGDFTSLELLAVDMNAGATLGERARALQERLWMDLDHRLFSGTEVMREIIRRTGEISTLFPVVFTSSIGVSIRDDGPAKSLGELYYGITQTPQVWIDCQAMESRDGLVVNWDTRKGVLPEGVLDTMFSAFEQLLVRMAEDEKVWDESEPVKPPAEQLAQHAAANATQTPVPAGLLHSELLAQAERNPERTAVVAGTERLSFGELVARARNVAAELGRRAVSPSSRVAIMLEKSCDQVVAVLGTLLAGCVYVPVEADHPAARRARVAEDAGACAVLLHTSRCDANDWPSGLPLIAVDQLNELGSVESFAQVSGSADDPAYIIYTSGSTGAPKGVVMSHKSALNTVVDINRKFQVNREDRVLGLSNLGFDLSVYDIFGPLAVGGCLVLPDPAQRTNPRHWADLASEHRVTLWNSVPALLQMFCDYLGSERERLSALGSLRTALLSGDWIPLKLPALARDLMPQLEVVSLGGATEAAIWSIYHLIGAIDPTWKSIPYGRPLANQAFHVLDARLRPCPDWVPGELFIAGLGLAIGYHGDPEKTAARFLTHPRTGERLYRTGDMGRYMTGGVIEFLGRADRQVKVRGHRIELAEIEAALSEHPAVANASVLVDGGQFQDRSLVGFVETAKIPCAAARLDLARLHERCAVGAARHADPVLIERYEKYAAERDLIALASLCVALRAHGALTDEPHTLAAVRAALPQHLGAHCERFLQALVKAGLARSDGGNGFVAAAPDEALLSAEWARLARSAEALGESNLTKQAQAFWQALPGTRGEVDAVRNGLAQHGLDVLDLTHRESLPSRCARAAAAEVVHALAASFPGTVRLLELGSSAALKLEETCIAEERTIEATVSDSSPLLLDRARQQRPEGTDCRYTVFDVDQEYRAQGLSPNSFDIVFAGNVLHRASDVDLAILRLRELLTPGGYLVLTELTRDRPAISAALEIMRDLAGGKPGGGADLGESPFWPPESWSAALARAGGDIVLCRPDGRRGSQLPDMTIFAVRFKAERASVTSDELTAFLGQRLPKYMVPAQIQVIDAFPLTANAKVDQKRLQTWIGKAVTTVPVEGDGNRSELETRLLAVWSEVFESEIRSRDQGFLELGGNSLRAARLTGRLRELLPEARALFFDELLRHILGGATVAELSALLSAGQSEDGAARVSASATVVRELGGTDGPVWAIVHDGGGDLGEYSELAVELARRGRVVALLAEDAQLYTAITRENLIEQTAAAYLDALVSAGHLELRVIGLRGSAVLALEIARQLLESGAIVSDLTLIDPLTKASSARASAQGGENPVLLHTLAAVAAFESEPYAGDIRLICTGHREAETEFWQKVCLGGVTVKKSLYDSTSGALASALSSEDEPPFPEA